MLSVGLFGVKSSKNLNILLVILLLLNGKIKPIDSGWIIIRSALSLFKNPCILSSFAQN